MGATLAAVADDAYALAIEGDLNILFGKDFHLLAFVLFDHEIRDKIMPLFLLVGEVLFLVRTGFAFYWAVGAVFPEVAFSALLELLL